VAAASPSVSPAASSPAASPGPADLLGRVPASCLELSVAGHVAQLLGVAVPSDLEPLIVALLLGVVTDYSTPGAGRLAG
jgi:hypothetical protein